MSNFIKTVPGEFGVVTVSIDRPEALNALNRSVLFELKLELERLAQDQTVRVIVLRGSGEKAFVAGADIKEMQEMTRGQAIEFSRLGHSVATLLESIQKVTIAAVQGYALGGGMELALSCDFILASEKAQFGLPEVTLGVIPGFGGTIRLSRAVGLNRAKELIFTGERISAESALRLGLVSKVYPQEGFFDEVMKRARLIALNSLGAAISAKNLLNEFSESSGTNQKIDAETHQFGSLFGVTDQKEGMAAFVEKRPARFKGL